MTRPIIDPPFWAVESASLLKQLGTTEEGLSTGEAKVRMAHTTSLSSHRPSAMRLLWDQFRNPITILLFCSAVLTFSLSYYDAASAGEPFSLADAPDGCIIVCILLASGFLGFWQEWNAADVVAKLLGFIETRATVLRDGRQVQVSIKEVVIGDVICLSAGQVIPGDCRLMEGEGLLVNESALTGESFPVEKCTSQLATEVPLSDRKNSLFLGTYVVSGLGRAVVAATGRDTELGKISARLKHKPPETGFERGIRHFGQLLIKIVVLITVVVFAVKVGLQGRPLLDSLLVGLALAVGMTPQLLPAVTSVVLAAGAKAMSKQQVIIKQLLAIENLGSMTVLCSDKTGTLTEGSIRLVASLDATGVPSDRILQLAYLNAVFQTGFLNPIDQAICEAGPSLGDVSEIKKIDEVPYDFVRKRLSIRTEHHGRRQLITKGAFAQVLEVCTHVELGERTLSLEMDPESSHEMLGAFPFDYRQMLQDRFKTLSDQGLRVLGIAVAECDSVRISKTDESGMTFVGFLVFADPPKQDARDMMLQLRELGVGLKVITGDNRSVASAICTQVGIASPDIVTGDEIRNMNDVALLHRVREADIFAEVEPNQKERIILLLQRSGHVVGYLGDGINDATALHAADVGISVSGAVDVAKEAAEIVLLKHDLRVLVQGVREGRKTFSNTLKYVFFAIAANFGYMFSLAVSGLFIPFEPLLASQILLVNLLADFPAMALATDNVDPEQVAQPTRWDTQFLLRFMMSFGLASSCFDFLTFGAMYWLFSSLSGSNPAAFAQLFQTGWFIESTLTGLVILLAIRTQRPLLQSRPGRLFLIAEVLVAMVTMAIPFTPLGGLMGFIQPPGILMLATITITALYGIGMETVKSMFYRHLHQSKPNSIRST